MSDDPGAFLAPVQPLLKRHGRIVLTTPSVAHRALRLSLLGGRWRYADRGLLDRSHVHLFTRKTLVETLDNAGYRVLEVDFTAPMPSPLAGRRHALERVAHAVGRLRPSLFAYQFIVAAEPK